MIYHHGTPEPITSDTTINAPDAAQLATEAYTLTRRQRKAASSKRLPKSSTAYFSFDTPILMELLGFAHWQSIHKVEKGGNVIQLLPSGNIDDLTDAITTPIKTNCSFDQLSTGGIDMVRMGSCCITPHHHILMADGWTTARQAADMGQGEILANFKLPRVYNLCLEGGGNIIINSSSLPGLTTLTTAATMGYRFEPATDSQQKGSLTYRKEVRNRLGQSLDANHSAPVMYRPFPMENLSLITPQATFLQENGLALAQSSHSFPHPYRITAHLLND